VTPFNAAEVVDVTVSVDHRDHGSVTTMLPIQRQRRRGGLRRDQRVYDDHTGVTLDKADVGQVVTPDLVDPRGHLEQALLGHQHRLAPQARVHRVRRIAGEKVGVGPVVPHRLAAIVADNRLACRDEPPLGGVEIGGVFEGKSGGGCGHGRVLPLDGPVSSQRLALLPPDGLPQTR